MIDKMQMVREIEEVTRTLVNICYSLMGAEPGTEEAEALNAVADACNILELYLYPDSSWSDNDIYMDDGD